MSRDPRIEWSEDRDAKVVEIRLVVEGRARAMRVDRYVCRRFPKLSRTRAQEIIRTTLTINDHPVRKPGAMVHQGDVLVIRRPLKEEPATSRDVKVLEDFGTFLAVDKPAGLPVHPAGRYYLNTVTTVLRERFGSHPKIVVVHRLDRETSGVLLVCRDKAVERALKQMFQDRRVRKAYLAIVRGRVLEPGRIDLPLGQVIGSRIHVKMHVTEEGAPAVTEFSPLRVWDEYSLVEARPRTGRQHQIRAHMAAIGHPIVGDKMYGVPEDWFFEFLESGMTDSLLERLELSRQALHAARLEFVHPETGSPIVVNASLAEDMADFLAGLGTPRWEATTTVDGSVDVR